jgi:hypothetical protein
MEGVNSSMRYLTHDKNLCKCHSVHHPAQQQKTERAIVHILFGKGLCHIFALKTYI